LRDTSCPRKTLPAGANGCQPIHSRVVETLMAVEPVASVHARLPLILPP